jgi:hypothetical protein
LAVSSFHNWKKEIGRRDVENAGRGPVQFAEVRAVAGRSAPGRTKEDAAPGFVDGDMAQAGSAIEIVLAGGRAIRVSPGFDEGTLSRLISLLEGRPC